MASTYPAAAPMPPSVRGTEPAQPPPQSYSAQASQQMDSSKSMVQQSFSELLNKVESLGTQIKEIFDLAQSTMPSVIGHLAKMTEIAIQAKKDIQEAVQQMSQGPGQGARPPAPSPTDAQPADMAQQG